MDRCKAEGCGGCAFQGIPYEEQLAAKEKEVRSLLKNYESVFEGIQATPSQYNYRNKMEYTFGNLAKGEPMCLGMHKKGSYLSLVDASCCQIVPEDFNTLVKLSIDFCNGRGYTFYHKKAHEGLMRNLILRQGVRTGELLVNIVTNDGDFDEQAFVELVKHAPLKSAVTGILHTINRNRADAFKCDELRLLDGHPYYMEEIMGLKFKVGPFSFFQTNVEAAERLYTQALELIPNVEGKTCFDLYCGTGTITQALALKAKEAIGVEIVAEAVDAARENAALNGLDNCRFICGDVGEVIDSIEEKPDVIVVDPPRIGMTPKAMNRILAYGIPEILYISCNPKSLAENLRQAAMSGYKPVKIRAYDNFAFTSHVETVCLLINQNAKAKHHVNVGIDAEDYYKIKEGK